MAACIATTATVSLGQDGAGTLRANAIVSGANNNPLTSQADGLVVRPVHVTYGWPFGGDDTYNVAAGVAPQFGPLVYGPELFAQTQTASVGCVRAEVEWECQAGYTGSNTFSGIQFELQQSYDHTNWSSFYTDATYEPSSQTILRHIRASWPICFGDNGLHNTWFRLVLSAGAFGTGDVVTAQFSRRRSVTMWY